MIFRHVTPPKQHDTCHIGATFELTFHYLRLVIMFQVLGTKPLLEGKVSEKLDVSLCNFPPALLFVHDLLQTIQDTQTEFFQGLYIWMTHEQHIKITGPMSLWPTNQHQLEKLQTLPVYILVWHYTEQSRTFHYALIEIEKSYMQAVTHWPSNKCLYWARLCPRSHSSISLSFLFFQRISQKKIHNTEQKRRVKKKRQSIRPSLSRHSCPSMLAELPHTGVSR